MLDLQKEIAGWREEANVDFTSLWHIASVVEDKIYPNNQKDVIFYTMKIVEGLMKVGVFPGNYTLGGLKTVGFIFWRGEPEELVKRIEVAWIALGKTPDPVDDICWFALRQPDAE